MKDQRLWRNVDLTSWKGVSFFLVFFSRLRGFFIVLTCIKYISLKDYAHDVFKFITYKFCLLTLFF